MRLACHLSLLLNHPSTVFSLFAAFIPLSSGRICSICVVSVGGARRRAWAPPYLALLCNHDVEQLSVQHQQQLQAGMPCPEQESLEEGGPPATQGLTLRAEG